MLAWRLMDSESHNYQRTCPLTLEDNGLTLEILWSRYLCPVLLIPEADWSSFRDVTYVERLSFGGLTVKFVIKAQTRWKFVPAVSEIVQ